MAISELNVLIKRCLHRRVGPVECSRILAQYRVQTPFSNQDLVVAILNASLNFCVEGDPILPQYLQTFLHTQFIELIDLIAGWIRLWRTVLKTKTSTLPKCISVLTYLTTNLTFNNPGEDNTRKCIELLSQWLHVLIKTLPDHAKDVNIAGLVEAIGTLLASLSTPSALSSKKTYANVQTTLDRCMDMFPAISMQLMNRLSAVPKPDVFENRQSSPSTLNLAAYQFEANIHDTQILAGRATTTFYLNKLLRTGTTIDDSTVFSFLSTRYQSNNAMMFNEIVFASVDALCKTSDSSDELYQTQCQLFILDKLPFILSNIVTSAFESFSSEAILIDAWNYLNASGYPEAANVGSRFLRISSFHQLIPDLTVSSLVGDDSHTGLKGFYAKDDLVSQVVANHSRGPRLVEELLKKDGNAGSIGHAITEIMHNYCISKDTQHLKDMANAIVRKPAAINAITMFTKPAHFLTPFCTLLDDWRWDEIHGESQPVYDDFGSVFLLISAVKQRLRLDKSQLGIQRTDGFLARYFTSRNSEHELSKLPEPSQKHLGDWIRALYIDEALSDELTTNCSAQEFYQLVPTLIRQTVLARSRGKLSTDSFKAGLEYLLEPFLLPSLLPVFGWLSRIAGKETTTVVEVMQIFMKQPDSGENRELHHAVLSMATDQMRLLDLPRIPAIAKVLDSFKSTPFTIGTAESDSVLIEAAATDVDVLSTRLAQVAVGEVFHSEDILIKAVESFGSNRVIQLLLNLLIQTSGSSSFHSVLDFVATATSLSNSLHNSLLVIHENLAVYLKKDDNLFAEAIVHLFRRVELYSHALTVQTAVVDQVFATLAGLNAASINLDAGPVAGFTSADQVQNEDIDQVMNEAAVLGGLDSVNTNSFDDMYGLQPGDLSMDDLDLDMF